MTGTRNIAAAGDRRRGAAGLAMTAAAGLWADMAEAQPAGPPDGPAWRIDGIAGWSAPAGLEGGGKVAAARGYAGAGVSVPLGGGVSVGFEAGGGFTDYRFSDGAAAPWGDIRDVRVTLPVRFGLGDRGTAILAPSLRWTAETDADLADGRSAGLFAAAFWKLSDSLTLGPGIGVFSEPWDDTDVFAFLAIDWKITARWRLSTGQGVGATQGPGLSLSYAVTEALAIGIAGRIEDSTFRLDDRGPAPGGYGEARSLPVVATLDWSPHPGLAASAFLGVDTGGTLTLRDGDGHRVDERDVDPAPVLGAQIRVRF
ncbi:MAG: hypothetical protein KDA73_11160 [Rhodobacteraceae bacterium]|nr:hypothetical protein [Paracoccaceae bacterium]